MKVKNLFLKTADAMKEAAANKAVGNALSGFGDWAVDHDVELLAGFGVGLFLWGMYEAIKVAPDAKKKLKKHKKALGCYDGDKIGPVETVKAVGPDYAKPAIITLFAIACIVGSVCESKRKISVISAAAALSEATLGEYVKVVKEKEGEEKEAEISKEAAERVLAPVTDKAGDRAIDPEEMAATKQMFYDPITDSFFTSTVTKVERAFNRLTAALQTENRVYVSGMSDYLPVKTGTIGNDMGWSTDFCYDIRADFDPMLEPNTHLPYIYLNWDTSPRYV